MVYDGLPSNEVIHWAIKSRQYYSGALILYDAHNMPLEKIFFEDGACIGMNISYISDEGSPIYTGITVSPRVLKIGDRTITQPWKMDEMSDYQKRIAPKLTKLAQPIGKTDLWLTLKGKKYEIAKFDLSFHQTKDFKGQPISGVLGGKIIFTIDQLPDDELKKWMCGELALMNGEFSFKQGDKESPLRIEFNEGFCVRMIPYKSSKGELCTALSITANELILNGRPFFKDWYL